MLLDRADYTGPTRQHELGHRTSCRIVNNNRSALKDLHHELGIGGLSEVWNVTRSFGQNAHQIQSKYGWAL